MRPLPDGQCPTCQSPGAVTEQGQTTCERGHTHARGLFLAEAAREGARYRLKIDDADHLSELLTELDARLRALEP